MNLHSEMAASAAEAARVVCGVSGDQLSAATPCTDWDLRALLNHMILWTAYSAERRARDEQVPSELVPPVPGAKRRPSIVLHRLRNLYRFRHQAIHHLPRCSFRLVSPSNIPATHLKVCLQISSVRTGDGSSKDGVRRAAECDSTLRPSR